MAAHHYFAWINGPFKKIIANKEITRNHSLSQIMWLELFKDFREQNNAPYSVLVPNWSFWNSRGCEVVGFLFYLILQSHVWQSNLNDESKRKFLRCSAYHEAVRRQRRLTWREIRVVNEGDYCSRCGKITSHRHWGSYWTL